MGLLDRCVAKGLNLQTNTPVHHISDSPSPTDNRYAITTPRGTIRAKKIVLATNAYTQSIAPQYADKIVPIRGMCSRIVPVATKTNPSPSPFLPYTYLIRYAADYGDYLISRADGSIVVGGGRHHFWHEKDEYYNNVDDGSLIESAKTHFDELMQRNYLGWDGVKTEVGHLWSGSELLIPSVLFVRFLWTHTLFPHQKR